MKARSTGAYALIAFGAVAVAVVAFSRGTALEAIFPAERASRSFSDKVWSRVKGQRKGCAQRLHDADGVFIAPLQHFLRRRDVASGSHGDLPDLHIPVAREFVPADLDGPGDDIRFFGTRVLFAAACTPAPLHGEAAQHGSFAGARGGAADGGPAFRSVPQIGQHVHAAHFDFGRLRIFVLVDHVLADGFVHQTMHLPFLEGGAERGQIQPGVPVDHQFIADQLIYRIRLLFLCRKTIFLRRPFQRQGRVYVISLFRFQSFSHVQSHFSLLLSIFVIAVPESPYGIVSHA